jgi:hypothetical protein
MPADWSMRSTAITTNVNVNNCQFHPSFRQCGPIRFETANFKTGFLTSTECKRASASGC